MKVKYIIGVGLTLIGAGALYWKRHLDGMRAMAEVEQIIQKVDEKKTDKKDKGTEDEKNPTEIADEVNQAMAELGLGTDERDASEEIDYEKAMAAIQEKKEKRMAEIERLTIDDYRKMTFPQMKEQFDWLYNPYPIEISPASAFGQARGEGLIDDDMYAEAADYYGKLWFYVGD